MLASDLDYTAAHRLASQARTNVERALGTESLQVVPALELLAEVQEARGAYAEARALRERVVALTSSLPQPGRRSGATDVCERLLAGIDAADQTTRAQLDRAAAHECLATAAMARGQPAVAVTLYRQHGDAWRRIYGDDAPALAASRLNLADAHLASGEFDEARACCDEVLAITRRSYGHAVGAGRDP